MINPEVPNGPNREPVPVDLAERALNLIDRLAVKTVGEDNTVRRGVYRLPEVDGPLALDWLVVRAIPSYGAKPEDYIEYYELLIVDELVDMSGEPASVPALSLVVDRGELFVTANGEELDNHRDAARANSVASHLLDWVEKKETAGLIRPTEETADAIDKLDPGILSGYLSMLAADLVNRLGRDGKVALHVYGGKHAKLEIFKSGRHLCLTNDWTDVDEGTDLAEHLLVRHQSHIFYEDDNLISIFDWLEKGRLVPEISEQVQLVERERLDERVDMGLVGDRLLHLVLMLENAKPDDVISPAQSTEQARHLPDSDLNP